MRRSFVYRFGKTNRPNVPTDPAIGSITKKDLQERLEVEAREGVPTGLAGEVDERLQQLPLPASGSRSGVKASGSEATAGKAFEEHDELGPLVARALGHARAREHKRKKPKPGRK